MKKFAHYLSIVILAIFLGATVPLQAQTPSAPAATDSTQTDEEKQKEKEALEKKAAALLEQILSEVQLLKLPENRIRVQIAAGDLLWKRNEARARSMFSMATDGLTDLIRNGDGKSRGISTQLRQELV